MRDIEIVPSRATPVRRVFRGATAPRNRGAWFTASTYAVEWERQPHPLVDMNGDGMADCCSDQTAGNWFLLQSSGASFIDKGLIILWRGAGTLGPIGEPEPDSRLRRERDGLQDIIIGPDAERSLYQLSAAHDDVLEPTSPDLLRPSPTGRSSTSVPYTPSTHYNNTYCRSAAGREPGSITTHGNNGETQYSYLVAISISRNVISGACRNQRHWSGLAERRPHPDQHVFSSGNDYRVGSNIRRPVGYMKEAVASGSPGLGSRHIGSPTLRTPHTSGTSLFRRTNRVLSTYCSSSGAVSSNARHVSYRRTYAISCARTIMGIPRYLATR